MSQTEYPSNPFGGNSIPSAVRAGNPFGQPQPMPQASPNPFGQTEDPEEVARQFNQAVGQNGQQQPATPVKPWSPMDNKLTVGAAGISVATAPHIFKQATSIVADPSNKFAGWKWNQHGWGQGVDMIKSGGSNAAKGVAEIGKANATLASAGKGAWQATKGVGRAASGALHYLPAVDVATGLYNVGEDIMHPQGRGAAYGGGFWGHAAGAAEGLANGLTAGGYDATRGFFDKSYNSERMKTVNTDPLGTRALGEWLGDLMFSQSQPAYVPKNNF